jgi:hypothetical protein
VIDVLALVAVALAIYGPLLEPGQFPFSKHSDLVMYAWPTKQVLYDALHEGRGLPLWRSDQLSGNVALTQPQALYTYPLHALYWVLPPLEAAGPTFWLELLLAGLGAYVLGAVLGVGRAARLLMAVAQLTSFKLLSVVYAGWVPVLPALSLLPWFLAALLHFVEHRTLSGGLLLAAAAALAFHAGTLQPYYYAGLFFAPWILAHSFSLARRGETRDAAVLLGGIAAAGLLGFSLSAHLWLPILADIPLLSRGSLPYEFFLSGHALELENLRTLLNPEALGTPMESGPRHARLWESSMYFGWVPLALAVIGAVTGRPRALARYLALAAIATVAISFDTPLLRALYQGFPGFALVRIPTRVLFLTGVVVVALAGLGADALLATLRRHARRSAAVVVIACLSLMIGEGVVRARRYLQMLPVSDMQPELPVAAAIDDAGGPYRTIRTFPIPYGWCSSLGLELITGYDPYGFGHYRRYLAKLSAKDKIATSPRSLVRLPRVRRFDMLDALNVRYFVGMPAQQTLPQGWREIGRWEDHPAYRAPFDFFKGPLILYERSNPVARAFFVDRVVTVRSPEEALTAMDDLDMRSAAVVETDAAIPQTTAPGDAIRDIDASPGSLHFSTHTRGQRFAVVSEVWHPGWSASVDGHPVSLRRTDHALLGLEIPPGKHRVDLSFTPPAWKLGICISLASLVVVVGLTLAAARTRAA